MESNTILNVYFNFDEIKSNVIRRVSYEAIEKDGVIFGGAVRDMMIADVYSKRYTDYLRTKKERYNAKKFWNAKNHPETSARTLVPDDVDIYFSSSNNADRFIQHLRELCETERILFDIKGTHDDPSDTGRNYGMMLNVQKATLTIQVGAIPFVCRAYDIYVDIDIISPNYPIIMQPPFCNLDFLCNGFIKTKFGILYSNDTGTYIDRLPELQRTAEILKIQQDMVEFKTNFCRYETIRRKELGTMCKNRSAFKRINKLLAKKHFPWTICNLPLKMAISEAVSEEYCSICLDHFKPKDRHTYIETIDAEGTPVKSSMTHTDCIMTYLAKQLQDAERQHLDDKDKFSYVCPLRHPIDFTQCSYDYKL